jgi:MFS transporter, ACS family, allantoate permease
MGNIMLWKTSRDNKAALLAGLYIVGLSSSSHPLLFCAIFLNTLMCAEANINNSGSKSTTFYGSLVQHYSLLAANIGGHSKKTTVMGTITIMSALGGFSGPWAYKGSQASEGYPDGQIATLSLFCASILAYIILWYATDVPFIFPRPSVFSSSSMRCLVDGFLSNCFPTSF